MLDWANQNSYQSRSNRSFWNFLVNGKQTKWTNEELPTVASVFTASSFLITIIRTLRNSNAPIFKVEMVENDG